MVHFSYQFKTLVIHMKAKIWKKTLLFMCCSYIKIILVY
jgi:hypothetical protein